MVVNSGGRLFDAGAAAAVIGPAAAACPPAVADPVLVVPEPVARTIGELSAAFWEHPSQRMALIGVTGTNGKTTTTHLIEHLANSAGTPTAMFGTLVNRWPGHSITATHTTAFADHLQGQLAEAVSAGSRLAAMEVSSHALAQHRVAGCRFSGAVFTNLSQDHLDYHASMEDYFDAKASLFTEPYLLSGAARAVVNADDPWGAQLAARLGSACWRSSLSDGSAELSMTDLRNWRRDAWSVQSGMDCFVPVAGVLNLMNPFRRLRLQQELPLPHLIHAVGSFGGVPGRMERVVVAGAQSVALPTVLVDYAHTPDGLENALAASRPFCDGRLICVFGCGGDRDRGKRPQMGAIAARLADRVGSPRTIPHGGPSDPRTPGRGSLRVHALWTVTARPPLPWPLRIHRRTWCWWLQRARGITRSRIKKVHFDDREESHKALQARLKEG